MTPPSVRAREHPQTLHRGDAGDPARPRSRRGLLAGAGIVFAALLAIGIVPRITRHRQLVAEAAAADSMPSVLVASATRAATDVTIALPGTIQPLHQAPVYARINGYVRRWYADLGARVRAGQLLATIESPETDQQLLQAKASLEQARAALALAATTLERYRALAADSAITRQELDERATAYDAARATVAQQEANVQRLAAQQAYERVVAPFAGIITSRNVDVGALISAAGGSTTAAGASAPLFSLAQVDTIRIFVAVPQTEVTSVAVGQRAEVTLREYPGRIFSGVVARTAGALDPGSRTLQAEIDVPNADGALLPGMYAEVRLALGRANPPLTIPAGALVIGTGAPRVATVDRSGVVTFREVQLGRDYGPTVEVLSGIDDGATLVLNPSDELRDGVRVRPVRAKAEE